MLTINPVKRNNANINPVKKNNTITINPVKKTNAHRILSTSLQINVEQHKTIEATDIK